MLRCVDLSGQSGTLEGAPTTAQPRSRATAQHQLQHQRSLGGRTTPMKGSADGVADASNRAANHTKKATIRFPGGSC